MATASPPVDFHSHICSMKYIFATGEGVDDFEDIRQFGIQEGLDTLITIGNVSLQTPEDKWVELKIWPIREDGLKKCGRGAIPNIFKTVMECTHQGLLSQPRCDDRFKRQPNQCIYINSDPQVGVCSIYVHETARSYDRADIERNGVPFPRYLMTKEKPLSFK